MAIKIGRRRFLSVASSAAVALPFAAQGQQAALPVVGFLNGDRQKAMHSKWSRSVKA